MSKLALDFTVNLPMLGGGAIFLFTMGNKLGAITQELKRIGKVADELPELDKRVTHLEGQLGIELK